MSSSGSVFSATLQTITDTKLEELSKKRIEFNKQHSLLLSESQHEDDPLKRLALLLDGVKTCFSVKTASKKRKADGRLSRAVYGATSNARLETDLRNIDRFLEQAHYDPSLSSKTIKAWEDCLLKYLEVQSTRYQYADLYGKLVTEWLSPTSKDQTGGRDVDMAESFEKVPGADKLESRAEWERNVFSPGDVDLDALSKYLDKLFTGTRGVAKALQTVRDRVQQFESDLIVPDQFSIHSLRWVITGLLNSDLLTNDKQAVLRDFEKNNIILAEVADVLNMRMSRLDSWSWGTEVPLEQRRMLNGRYNIFMHEDLLQAIFLQCIGVKWSVFLKGTLKELRRNEAAWKTLRTNIPKDYKKSRNHCLGYQVLKPSVQSQRRSTHRKNYFLFQLLGHEAQSFEGREGEEEADFEDFVEYEEESEDMPMPTQSWAPQQPAMAVQQMQQRSVQATGLKKQANPNMLACAPYAAAHMGIQNDHEDPETENDEEDQASTRNPMEVKQGLLHLLSTEIAVNTRLHGEMTCFRSIFDHWNPNLPHATILAVLSFFGASDKWQAFFKKFLEAPLKFDDDDESVEPRKRRRGTPSSHALSDVFGEVVLFCLDFSINRETGGALLYRVYDDIWFWSPDYEKVVKAWKQTTEFTEVMGVKLNKAKTGTVRIVGGNSDESSIDKRLPNGQIRWGFLYLDARTGRFEIDQAMVDSHIGELKTQLQGQSKSVFDYIAAWNAYAATFFTSNFGKAANCFGRKHVDRILATHRRIQESVFQGSNVVDFLKSTISDRFKVNDVPDGFLYFPVELGGLGLKSPFASVMQIRDSVQDDPFDLLDKFEEEEQDAYRQNKNLFDKGAIVIGPRQNNYYQPSQPSWKPTEGANEFMSFEEFTRYREEYSDMRLPSGYMNNSLLNVYKKLLERPTEESIDVSVTVQQAINQLSAKSNLKGITRNWTSMEPYWKWVAQLYGPEMVDRFGGLNVVDPGMLPIGMVSLLRDKRVKWQE